MATAAQALADLTSQVASLTAEVQRLSVDHVTIEVAFKAGYDAGQKALTGRAVRTSRAPQPRGSRPSHLQPVRSES